MITAADLFCGAGGVQVRTDAVRAWVVVSGDGIVRSGTNSANKIRSMACAESQSGLFWQDLEDVGYSCIEVAITPVAGEGVDG